MSASGRLARAGLIVGGISVELNGAAPEAALAACLSEIEVRQALNAPILAVLTFLDPAVAATGAIAIGTTVTLQAPDGAQLFSGEVTVIKRRVNGARARLIEVRAYDRLHRLRKRQTLRAMTNANVND